MAALVSIEDLLSSSLEQYRPAFHQSGFDHLDHLLTMEEDEWQHMLSAISEEFARMNQGVPMKQGHRMMIMSRLKQEKLRRLNEARERNERLQAEHATRLGAESAGAAAALGHTGTLTGTGTLGAIGSPRRTRTGNEGRLADGPEDETKPPSTKTVVVMQGFKCLGSHWMCCFGISMMSLVVSLFLYLLYTHLTASYASRPDNAWEFVRVLWICGFTVACVTFCICSLSWLTNPEQRTCEMPQGCCDLESGISCPSCGDGAPGGGCSELCAGCSASCPSCSSPDGPSNCALPGCPDCKCDCCNLEYCKALVGPCELPSCDCCPSCDGCSGCIETCTKIVCCRCKIQIS